MDATTVTLGGKPVQLQPLPFDERADVAVVDGDLARRGAGLAARQLVYFAALGLSLPRGARVSASYDGCPENLRSYGRQVYRELRGRGLSHAELFRAGINVYLAASEDTFPTVQEAKERADFSGAGGEPASSSPSTSPSFTATTPAGSTDSAAGSSST